MSWFKKTPLTPAQNYAMCVEGAVSEKYCKKCIKQYSESQVPEDVKRMTECQDILQCASLRYKCNRQRDITACHQCVDSCYKGEPSWFFGIQSRDDRFEICEKVLERPRSISTTQGGFANRSAAIIFSMGRVGGLFV